MTPRISTMLLRKIFVQARGQPGAEICGILTGNGAVVCGAQQTANIAPDPSRAFEIDPAALIAAYRLEREADDRRVLGFYHSHPNGDVTPSRRDADAAAPDGRLWLIVSINAARLWRAVPKGSVFGRFDPVAFEVATGKRVIWPVRRVRICGTSKGWSLEFDDFPD